MVLIILIIVFVGLYVFIKSPSSKERNRPSKQSNYSVAIEPREPQKKQTSVQRRKDGAMVINRGKSSQITLINATPSAANSIVEIYYGVPSFYEQVRQVQSILLENTISVEEINFYQSKVRPIIENRVQKLISEDEEWLSLGEMDKRDKQQQYLENSMSEYLEDYYNRPSREEKEIDFDSQLGNEDENDYVAPGFKDTLSYLALNAPIDVPLLNEMIHDYGLTNINTYYEYYGRKNPVISIANPNYRKPLEDLVKVGLACTGKDMSVEELLSSLTLNKLNEISGAETRFTRKDKAIKYLCEQNNIYSIIEKNVALRSLFALKPLPTQYQDFDFDKYHKLKAYYDALADVVVSVIDGCASIPFVQAASPSPKS